ncbi:MAG: hypothetical protein PUB94_00705 [Oscillospiraceae bacterium]|nr:hypothetical protein [Oscillospiraceae bacterium]
MIQYGLTESVEKSAEPFVDLTVSRVISQGKGMYLPVSSHGKKRGDYQEDSYMVYTQKQNTRQQAILLWLTGTKTKATQ